VRHTDGNGNYSNEPGLSPNKIESFYRLKDENSETSRNDKSEIEKIESLFLRYKLAAYKKIWLLILILIILPIVAGYFLQTEKPVPKNSLGIRKIAVLPFRSISPDDEMTKLKQGMTDSLITRLSKINELSVLPSALIGGYEKSGKSPLDFGSQIGADAVLDGTISRNNNLFIVNIQLFSIADGNILWSDTFQSEFTDILETQTLITLKITQALSLELSDKENRAIMKKFTTSAEAYRLFLDANYIQNFRKGKEARVLAENYYERAIELDPNFAMAYVNLANLQIHSPSKKAYLKMKVLSEQALKIDPELGEAVAILGFAVWRGEWNWTESEKYLKRAIETAPNDYGAFGTYSMILVGQGNFDEALKINALDKTGSPTTKIYEAAIFFFRHDFDKTIEICLERLKENPKSIGALSYLAPSYSFKGEHNKAVETAEKYAALDETADVGSLVYLSLAHIKAGNSEKGKEVLRQILEKDAPDSAQIHGGVAMLYGELGEKDKAFAHLEKSIKNREWWAFTLKFAPYYDSLRSDKRFGEMLRHINLAE
jgi:TolB-like protein/Tfp pilus assembly protein PilF